MLTISRIDHIGQVVPDLDAQAQRLERLFGFRRTRQWENAAQGARGALFEVPGRSGIHWEVQAPLSGDSPLQAFLDSPRGPGVHHIAVAVPDVDAAVQELEGLGITPDARGDGWVDTLLSPPEGGSGLLFRLYGAQGGPPCSGDGAAGAAGATGGEQGSTLGIVAVDHVCQAFRDRDELARWYERLWGLREIWRTPDGAHEDLADLVMEIPGGQMLWEIIMPVGEGSFIQRFLDTRGAAAHHTTFQVSDWDQAMAACEAHEVPTFDANQGETDGARWHDAFMHPKHTGGVLVQLFWEERPGVWVRSDKIPSGR